MLCKYKGQGFLIEVGLFMVVIKVIFNISVAFSKLMSQGALSKDKGDHFLKVKVLISIFRWHFSWSQSHFFMVILFMILAAFLRSTGHSDCYFLFFLSRFLKIEFSKINIKKKSQAHFLRKTMIPLKSR